MSADENRITIEVEEEDIDTITLVEPLFTLSEEPDPFRRVCQVVECWTVATDSEPFPWSAAACDGSLYPYKGKRSSPPHVCEHKP